MVKFYLSIKESLFLNQVYLRSMFLLVPITLGVLQGFFRQSISAASSPLSMLQGAALQVLHLTM